MGLATATPSAGRSGAPLPLVALTRAGLILVALATLLVFPAVNAMEDLQLERAELADGESYRLLTCHFAHWTWEHLAYDLFAFVLLGWLCLERGIVRTLGALSTAALVIPVAFMAWHPELEVYRGLSGLDAALFALLAGSILREGIDERLPRRVWLGGAALAGFAAKIAFELATGSAFFATSDVFVPIPIAHVAGAVCGVAAAFWRRAPEAISRPSSTPSASPPSASTGA